MSNPMENPNLAEVFFKFINLTLCIETEIHSTLEFIEFEIISAYENDYAIELDTLNDFKAFYINNVYNTFFEKVFDKINNENDDRIPNLGDYLIHYNNLDAHFWQSFVNCSNYLRDQFEGLYGLNSINNLIDQFYPGISHNRNLFPHVEMLNFFKKLPDSIK